MKRMEAFFAADLTLRSMRSRVSDAESMSSMLRMLHIFQRSSTSQSGVEMSSPITRSHQSTVYARST